MNQYAQETNELKIRLYKCFIKDNQNLCNEVIKALDNGDIKLAHRLVHNLKSNAGIIEETRLFEVALATERMLVDEKNLLTTEQMHLLETELNIVLEKLSVFAEEKVVPPVELDEHELYELLDTLETLLKGGDSKCLTLLDKLRAINGSETLVQLIGDYEFEKAIIAFNDFKEKLDKKTPQKKM